MSTKNASPEVLAAATVLLQGLSPGLTPARLSAMLKDSVAPPDAGPFLTPREAAAALRVSKMTILRKCRTGEIPARRIGRQWRIPEAACRCNVGAAR